MSAASAGRALLSRRHRLRLIVAVTLTPRHGKASTRRLRVTVT